MAITLLNSRNQIHAGTPGAAILAQMRVSNVPERALFVFVSYRSNSQGSTSVIWRPTGGSTTGQVNLTLIATQSHASQALRHEVWALLAPTPSTNATSAIVVTPAGPSTVRVTFYGVLYGGVDQTTPYAGYPSTPTHLVTQSGTTIGGTATGALATTVDAATDLVLDHLTKDNVGGGTERVTPSLGQRNYLARETQGAAGAVVGQALGAEYNSGTAGWNFLTSAGAAQSGHSYIHLAFPLKQSTCVAPYWVEPTNTTSTQNTTIGTTLTVESTANFPSSGIFNVGTHFDQLRGRAHTYAGKTGTAFSSASSLSGSGTAPFIGDRITSGQGNVATSGTAVTVAMPSAAAGALADDVAIAVVYGQGAGVTTSTISGSGWTAINQQDSAGVQKMAVLWKRLAGGDIGAAQVFTVDAVAVRCEATIALYRGCVTSGSPIGAGTDAPTTASGSGTTLTATALVPAVNDTTVLSIFTSNCVTFGPRAYLSGAGTVSNRGTTIRSENSIGPVICDFSEPIAATHAAQTVTTSATGAWFAQEIALLPAVGGATHARTIDHDDFTFSDADPSRAASIWARSRAHTAFTFTDNTPSRAASLWKRSRAHTAFTFTDNAPSRLRRIFRSRAHTAFTFTDNSPLRRGSLWFRSRAQGFTFNDNAPSRSLTGVVFIFRTIVQAAFTFTDNAPRRIGSLWKRSRAHTAFTFTDNTPSRAGTIWKRSRTHVAFTFTDNTPTRAGSLWRRAVAQSLAGFNDNAPSRAVIPAGLAFFAYGGAYAILRLFTASKFPAGAQFYLEADLSSNNAAEPAYARLWDVTGGAAVAGSQIQTPSSHTTHQRVRSGAITLIDTHVYRAEIGHNTGVATSITTADLIVEI